MAGPAKGRIESALGKVEGAVGINPFTSILFLFLAGLFIFLAYNPPLIFPVLRVAVTTSPVWLPIVLGYLFWYFWLNYIRSRYIATQEYTLMEIKLPREVFKSPLAMEAVLSGFHQGPGEANWIAKYIDGSVRPWFSLEIVSLEGAIHFYVWTRKFFVKYLKDQLYAHYPEIEISEVPDYARMIKYDKEEVHTWACDWQLSQPNPYPIKTYAEYGLLDNPKEEEKIDPLASLLESFGSIGPGEQLRLQILIQQNKNIKGLEAAAADEIQKIKEAATPPPREGQTFPGFPNLTKGDQESIADIERKIDKLTFEVGIRMMYVAAAGKFDATNIFRMLGGFKLFNSNQHNSFYPANWDVQFNYPWQKWFKREEHSKKKAFDAYRRRGYFHYPYKKYPPIVLSTEEIATMFHFPGTVVQTPTVERIPSRRAEAPSNLPI